VHEELTSRATGRRPWLGEALAWLLVALCGGAGFLIAFVITGDDRADELDDWLLAVAAGVAVVVLAAGTFVLHRRRRRRNAP
jgi:hypothetical protein